MDATEHAELLIQATGSAYELFEATSVREILLRMAAATAPDAPIDPELDAVEAVHMEFERLRAMGEAATPVVEELVRVVLDSSVMPARRAAALHVLVEVPDARGAGPAIVSALSTSEPEMVACALSAVPRLPLADAVAAKPILEHLLADATGRFQRSLQQTLFVVGEREAGRARRLGEAR
jgi:hypothetical protein